MADRNLNKGPVWRAIARVSAPMTLGILGVLLVGLSDAFFLARAGETELTAIGFIYPVIVALTSLAIGLSAGTNTVVSQSLGRGDSEKDGARIALHAVIMASTMATSVALLLFLGGPMLFGLMGAEGAVLDAVMIYVPLWCLSFVPMVSGMAINAVFRAGGQGSVAASVMVLQSLLNIGLNPILIFGFGPIPEMGIMGAGLATLLARIVGFAVVVSYALHAGVLRFDNRPLKALGHSLVRIGKVGVPAALSNGINPAGMAAVTAAVATIGDSAVAGFGAATRLQSLIFVPMLALSAGIGPVVGQAWGADRQGRARRAVALTHWACLGYGTLAAVAMLLFAQPLAQVMTDGAEAAGYTAAYLQIVGLSFFGYGILVTANAAMNARDRAVWSLGLSVARIALVYIPFAWMGVVLGGYTGILIAAVAANLLAVWGALVACRAVGLSNLRLGMVRFPALWLRSGPARAAGAN